MYWKKETGMLSIGNYVFQTLLYLLRGSQTLIVLMRTFFVTMLLIVSPGVKYVSLDGYRHFLVLLQSL